MAKKGCMHNPACPCFAGQLNCSNAVAAGECNPPTRVRINLGITLNNVDPRDFAKIIQENGGRIPMQGFA